eukprot:1147996-Pelagomonas_calceolata.AAC.2
MVTNPTPGPLGSMVIALHRAGIVAPKKLCHSRMSKWPFPFPTDHRGLPGRGARSRMCMRERRVQCDHCLSVPDHTKRGRRSSHQQQQQRQETCCPRCVRWGAFAGCWDGPALYVDSLCLSASAVHVGRFKDSPLLLCSPGDQAILDITDENAVKELATTAGELFEDISVLFNNAGDAASRAGPITSTVLQPSNLPVQKMLPSHLPAHAQLAKELSQVCAPLGQWKTHPLMRLASSWCATICLLVSVSADACPSSCKLQ